MAVSAAKHFGARFNNCLARMLSIPQAGPEISDRIVSFNAQTLAREDVHKQALLREFAALKNQRAASIVAALPVAHDDVLDAAAMDRLLVRVHCEMQRMSEEFQHGQRVAELLNPLLRALRQSGFQGLIRVVDIGCGTGYVLRWLTANKALAEDVELIGADYHPALVAEAQRLAAAENLSCRFVVANAFKLAQPAAVYLSTGILHHFRGAGLIDLFKQHQQPETCAFLHFDFHSSALAPFGSWLFHLVRMREPLARHDGVLSAARAHPSRELLAAARAGAPNFAATVYGTRLWGLPIPRAFHTLTGVRPKYRDAFVRNLGNRVASLGVIE